MKKSEYIKITNSDCIKITGKVEEFEQKFWNQVATEIRLCSYDKNISIQHAENTIWSIRFNEKGRYFLEDLKEHLEFLELTIESNGVFDYPSNCKEFVFSNHAIFGNVDSYVDGTYGINIDNMKVIDRMYKTLSFIPQLIDNSIYETTTSTTSITNNSTNTINGNVIDSQVQMGNYNNMNIKNDSELTDYLISVQQTINELNNREIQKLNDMISDFLNSNEDNKSVVFKKSLELMLKIATNPVTLAIAGQIIQNLL